MVGEGRVRSSAPLGVISNGEGQMEEKVGGRKCILKYLCLPLKGLIVLFIYMCTVRTRAWVLSEARSDLRVFGAGIAGSWEMN